MILRSSFPAMGNTASVEVDSEHAGLLPAARYRIEQLERAWSRFDPQSELSRLNETTDSVALSSDTELLLAYMREGITLTGGLFDPTLLPAVVEAGYACSLHDGAKASHKAGAVARVPFSVQVVGGLTSTSRELTIDPGAVGKGLAADLVARELRRRGAVEVCVSIGGDLTVAGSPRRVAVLSALGNERIAEAVLCVGSLATSSVTAKRFRAGTSHHVIDPRTLAPVDHDVVQATVIADQCAWAEMLATATLVAGHCELAEQLGLAALLQHADGTLERSSTWRDA